MRRDCPRACASNDSCPDSFLGFVSKRRLPANLDRVIDMLNHSFDAPENFTQLRQIYNSE